MQFSQRIEAPERTMAETATLEEPQTEQAPAPPSQALQETAAPPVTGVTESTSPAQQTQEAKLPVTRTRDGRFAPAKAAATDKLERESYERLTGEKVKTPPAVAVAATTESPDPEAPSSESVQDAAATPPQASEAPAPSAPKADAPGPKVGDVWDGTKFVTPAPVAVDKAELNRATWLLKRAQWEDEDIQKLSPEKIIAKANKLEPFLTRAESAASKAAAVDQSQEPAPNAEPDELDALLQGLDQQTVADPQVRAVVQRAEERAQAAINAANQVRIQSAFQSLFDEIPGLKDPHVIAKVIEVMDDTDRDGSALLANDPALLRSLAKQSAYYVLGDQIKQQSRQTAKARNKAQLDGQPSRITESRAPNTKPSLDEVEKSAYEKVMKKYGMTG